jgi:hypothetical protein
MARANNHGWDFVKVGKTYQYKEYPPLLAIVTILKDNSTEDEYRFRLRVEKSNLKEEYTPKEFNISSPKDLNGYYNNMIQLYENEEYSCAYQYERKNEKTKNN